MKKIQTCNSSEWLMLILAGGILSVMLAYRIFSWLCEVTAFLWWMILLALVMAALTVLAMAAAGAAALVLVAAWEHVSLRGWTA